MRPEPKTDFECEWLAGHTGEPAPSASTRAQAMTRWSSGLVRNGIGSTLICAGVVVVVATDLAAASTNSFSTSLNSASLPDAGPSLLRVFGALALVVGFFLAGVWLVRNGRFSAFGQNRATRLSLLETRSLGGRQSLHVVAYGQERFLIGATPAGINLLSHLAPQEDSDTSPTQPSGRMPFAQALAQVLRGQKPVAVKNEGAKA
jgi:flagellar biogenesis protein FliO